MEEGFKLGEVEYVPSPDRDWVIAVKSNGKNVMAGDLVSVVTPVVLVVGDGKKVEVFNGEEYTKDPEFKTDTVLVTELGSLGEGDVQEDRERGEQERREQERREQERRARKRAGPATQRPHRR